MTHEGALFSYCAVGSSARGIRGARRGKAKVTARFDPGTCSAPNMAAFHTSFGARLKPQLAPCVLLFCPALPLPCPGGRLAMPSGETENSQSATMSRGEMRAGGLFQIQLILGTCQKSCNAGGPIGGIASMFRGAQPCSQNPIAVAP